MTRGRAGKFAFDPAVVVAYLDNNSFTHVGGNPRRIRRTINGRQLDRDYQVRTIRRWRNATQGLTYQGVEHLLESVGLTVEDFLRWSAAVSREPVLRGELPINTTTTKEHQ